MTWLWPSLRPASACLTRSSWRRPPAHWLRCHGVHHGCSSRPAAECSPYLCHSRGGALPRTCCAASSLLLLPERVITVYISSTRHRAALLVLIFCKELCHGALTAHGNLVYRPFAQSSATTRLLLLWADGRVVSQSSLARQPVWSRGAGGGVLAVGAHAEQRSGAGGLLFLVSSSCARSCRES